jgi:hypothetical protein
MKDIIIKKFKIPKSHFTFVWKGKPFLPYQKLPYFWIVNLDKQDGGPGTHWTIHWTLNGKQYQYMDSFGMPSDRPTELWTKRNQAIKMKYLTNQIQHDDTATCGWFALHTMFHQWKKSAKNNRDIYSDFHDWFLLWNLGNKDLMKNEQRIEKWARQFLD